MDVFEAEKLTLFIAFVIPGFVCMKTYELICPGASRSASDQVVDAIAYSCINYAILFWPIKLVGETNLHGMLYYLFYFFVLLVSPVTLAFVWKRIRTSQRFQRNAPHPIQKPWDFLFQQRKCYWMEITLLDKTVIAGRFAEKSFASNSPAEEQIYLEEVWVLGENGQFERAVNRTEGILVLAKNISHIELRDL